MKLTAAILLAAMLAGCAAVDKPPMGLTVEQYENCKRVGCVVMPESVWERIQRILAGEEDGV